MCVNLKCSSGVVDVILMHRVYSGFQLLRLVQYAQQVLYNWHCHSLGLDSNWPECHLNVAVDHQIWLRAFL